MSKQTKRFVVTAKATAYVSTFIEAGSKAEALRIAKERELPSGIKTGSTAKWAAHQFVGMTNLEAKELTP